MIDGKPHIMIVDDNVNLTKMMARILHMKGYEVTVANAGLQAIELARENPTIDIVFMDIKMPGINGVETFKQMKEIHPDTHVVMMTAYAVEELIQEALREGAQGVIYKPVDFDQIESLIGRLNTVQEDAKILVVDDEEGIRKTFQNILTRKGYTVFSAASGEEAIELAKENTFDIMFVDMKLPGIDGLDTYLSIKLFQPEVIAIIVTGYAADMTNRIERLLLSSAYSCLHKPLDMDQVFGLLDEVMTKSCSPVVTGGA
jgi:DNA-binding NtrC family response regulator